MHAVTRTGSDVVTSVTELLQRIHVSHPKGGLFQAAEVQFWFARPHPTESLEQRFWLDDGGRPVAAALLFDFTGGSSLLYDKATMCPFVLADATAAEVGRVLDEGLTHAAALGFDDVELEVEREDEVMRAALAERGFEQSASDVLVECWLDADARPDVAPLADGYRLGSRAETTDRPHHMARSADEDLDARLAALSLYDPAHDLVVLADDDTPAAHGMFWFDPVTDTGVVEPMRTHDDHQQRGLARHVLTAGVELLARAGARRISIGYEPDNPASGHLYRSVGFEPVGTSDLFAGPTSRS